MVTPFKYLLHEIIIGCPKLLGFHKPGRLSFMPLFLKNLDNTTAGGYRIKVEYQALNIIYRGILLEAPRKQIITSTFYNNFLRYAFFNHKAMGVLWAT